MGAELRDASTLGPRGKAPSKCPRTETYTLPGGALCHTPSASALSLWGVPGASREKGLCIPQAGGRVEAPYGRRKGSFL